MRIARATSAGTPGQPNEDFVGAVPDAVVLLDGAGIPGTESICQHGVAWYTHRLGGALLGRLSRADGQSLSSILGDAIQEITGAHRGTCAVTDPSSPQATVVLFRVNGDNADYLLLADSFLLLDRVDGEPVLLTDDREVAARQRFGAAMYATAEGTPEYERARAEAITALREHRNRPGGYWIAKDDPRAAAEAVTGSLPTRDLAGAALLSNGASRLVDRYRRTDWPGLLALLKASGPAEILRRVREEEPAEPDDATVAFCTGVS